MLEGDQRALSERFLQSLSRLGPAPRDSNDPGPASRGAS
jgi:hypothetical protein